MAFSTPPPPPPLLLLLLLGLVASASAATWFYGGSVTFTPKGRNPDGTYAVELRNKQTLYHCGQDYFRCVGGDCGSETSRSISTVSQNSYAFYWCHREVVMERKTAGDQPFEIRYPTTYYYRYGRGYWITSSRYSHKPWKMTAHIDLGIRSDTGESNRSPTITSTPPLRITQNCPRRFSLAAFDHDDDRVTCRFGSSTASECSLCYEPEGFSLDQDSCTLSYSYTRRLGISAFELVVEDFPRKQITVSYSDRSFTIKAPLAAGRHRRAAIGSSAAPPGGAAAAGTTAGTTAPAPTTTTTTTPIPTAPTTTTTTPIPTAPTTTTTTLIPTAPTTTTTTLIPTAPTPVAPTPAAPTPAAPTPVAPTPAAPTPVAPTPAAPTPAAPTPAAPTPVAPTPAAPTPVAPTPAAPTPVAPTPVAPTPAAPTPAAPTPAVQTPAAPTTTTTTPTPVAPTTTTTTPTPAAPTPAAPTPVAPTPVAPTPAAPTPVAPTPVAPTSAAPTPAAPTTTTTTPTPAAPTPVAPTPAAPTPAAPTPAAPTPVAPTPVAPTSAVQTPAAPTTTTTTPTPVAPTPVAPTSAAPTPAAPTTTTTTPTPAAPTPVAPTPVAPTPVAPTPAAPTPVAPTTTTTTPTPVAPTPVAPTTTTTTPTPVAPTPTPVTPTTTTTTTTPTPAAPTTTTTLRTTTRRFVLSTAPLSKLPLQFSIYVDSHHAPSCQDGDYFPIFLAPTPRDGVNLPAFVNYTLEIKVRATAKYTTIYDLIISGPAGTTKHKTSSGEYTIKWTPTENEVNDHFAFCFFFEARDRHHRVFQSNLRCVVADVGHHDTVVHCSRTTMTVEVEKSYLIRRNENNLHLKGFSDATCSLRRLSNRTHLVAEMALNTCGTTLEEDGENLVFKNEITSADPSEVISRKHDVEIAFSCVYPKRTNLTLGFRHKNPYAFTEKGFGSFTFRFEFFESQRFRQQVDASTYPVEVNLKQMMFMQIEATSSIPNTELFVESCRATPYDNPNSRISYTIIDNGCVTDQTVQIYPASRSQFRFGMEAFEFIGAYAEVYITCSVILCEVGVPGTRCSQGCIAASHHRRRREAAAQTSSHSISQGPLHLVKPSDSQGLKLNLGVDLMLAACFLLALAAVLHHARRSRAKYQLLPSAEVD